MRKWLCATILGVVLAVAFFPGCGKRGDNVASGTAHLERGLAALDRGDFDKAMKDFTEAIKLMPDSATPHIAVGDLYNVQGQYEKAIESYRQALELSPGIPEVHFMIGFISKQWMGDDATGLVEISKAVELDSTSATYRYQLGEVLHSLERYEEAEVQLRQAIAINPDHAGAHFALGELYESHLGMLEQGFSEYEKAVAIDPENPDIRQSVGVAYARNDRFDDALRHFREYLKIAPDSPAVPAVEEAIRWIESRQGVTP